MYSIMRTNNEELVKSLHDKIFVGDEWYEHKGNVYWIIKCNSTGTTVGFCIGTDIGKGIFYLSRAGVCKSHRGNGLHKRLIRVRERYAKKNDFDCIITYTVKYNPQSFVHLVKTNYEYYQPDYAYAGQSCLYFRKLLTNKLK